MSEIDPQEFGELKACVRGVKKELEELHSDVKEIRAFIERSKGGLLGLAAAAGGGVATLLQYLHDRFLQ